MHDTMGRYRGAATAPPVRVQGEMLTNGENRGPPTLPTAGPRRKGVFSKNLTTPPGQEPLRLVLIARRTAARGPLASDRQSTERGWQPVYQNSVRLARRSPPLPPERAASQWQLPPP